MSTCISGCLVEAMKLIINADDFGYSRAINYGIIDAYNMGAVRSCTAMMNMYAAEHAADMAARNPGLGVGIHLVLTTGKSLTGGKSITDGEGNFLNQLVLMELLEKGRVEAGDIEAEFEAQIQKAQSLGFNIDHLDSHHHIHMRPQVLPIFLEKARKYGLAVRRPVDGMPEGYGDIKTTQAFTDAFYGDDATMDNLIALIERHSGVESLEVMSHPAYLDAEAFQGRYNTKRTDEYSILTDRVLMDYIEAADIQLVGFAGL